MKCLIISIMLILRFKVRERLWMMRVDFPLLNKLVIGKEAFYKREGSVVDSMRMRGVMK